jgi:hypothetical protein
MDNYKVLFEAGNGNDFIDKLQPELFTGAGSAGP